MKDKKKCPRCLYKMPSSNMTCPGCGLSFARLEQATNAEAKNALRLGENERVVYTTVWPADIRKWRLFFLALFFGWLGVHQFKVGKAWTGVWYLVVNLIGIALSVIDGVNKLLAKEAFMVFWYIAMLAWAITVIVIVTDVVKIAFNRFAVPVALPYKEQ